MYIVHISPFTITLRAEKKRTQTAQGGCRDGVCQGLLCERELHCSILCLQLSEPVNIGI